MGTSPSNMMGSLGGGGGLTSGSNNDKNSLDPGIGTFGADGSLYGPQTKAPVDPNAMYASSGQALPSADLAGGPNAYANTPQFGLTGSYGGPGVGGTGQEVAPTGGTDFGTYANDYGPYTGPTNGTSPTSGGVPGPGYPNDPYGYNSTGQYTGTGIFDGSGETGIFNSQGQYIAPGPMYGYDYGNGSDTTYGETFQQADQAQVLEQEANAQYGRAPENIYNNVVTPTPAATGLPALTGQAATNAYDAATAGQVASDYAQSGNPGEASSFLLGRQNMGNFTGTFTQGTGYDVNPSAYSAAIAQYAPYALGVPPPPPAPTPGNLTAGNQSLLTLPTAGKPSPTPVTSPGSKIN